MTLPELSLTSLLGLAALFSIAPLGIILVIALARPADTVPPFSFRHRSGQFRHRRDRSAVPDGVLAQPAHGRVSTMICLLIGYPMALAIARGGGAVARTIAAGADVAVLDRIPDAHQRLDRHVARRRLDQSALTFLGFAPVRLLYTDTALYIGMVYTYLPFMVLPVYARLAKLDATLLEAAADLGASPLRAFCA
jgi:putrescine transport system permease protein